MKAIPDYQMIEDSQPSMLPDLPDNEMAGATIAFADEEGKDLFDDDDDFDEEDDIDEFPGTDEENSVVIDTEEEDGEENGDDDDDDDDLLSDDADDDLLSDEDDEDEDEENDEDEDDESLYAMHDDSILDDQDTDEDYDESGDNVAGEREEMDADISAAELALLDQRGPQMPDSDSDNLLRSRLDDTDMEGDPLNEKSSGKSADGADLDVPGAELDDGNESLGEEDEENNMYSEADTA